MTKSSIRALVGLWLLFALLALSPLGHAATVRDCNAGEAPAAYTGDACSGKCFIFGGDTISCVIDVLGSVDATTWIVLDFALGGDPWYSAWGTDDQGNDFCCVIEDASDDIDYVELHGGDNDDTLSGAWGTYMLDDVLELHIEGGPGADTLQASDDVPSDFHGEAGADTLYGGAQADVLYGNGGVDTIYGRELGDTIYGGAGNDIIYGNYGADTMYGGGDDDTIEGGPGADTIYGEDGDDTIKGDEGDDEIWGGDGDDAISGNAGDDTIYGGSGADTICGGQSSASGSDYLHATEPSTPRDPRPVRSAPARVGRTVDLARRHFNRASSRLLPGAVRAEAREP